MGRAQRYHDGTSDSSRLLVSFYLLLHRLAWAVDRCIGIRDFLNRVVLDLYENPALPQGVTKSKAKYRVVPRFAMHFPAKWLSTAKTFAWPCDWIQFRSVNFVKEALLEYDWAREEARRLLTTPGSLVGQWIDGNDVAFCGERDSITKITNVDLNAVLPALDDPSFTAALGNLYAQFVDRYTVRVAKPADVKLAAAFATTVKQIREKPMRMNYMQLREDRRLWTENGRFQPGGYIATFAEGMEVFRGKTELPFAFHNDIDPQATMWDHTTITGGSIIACDMMFTMETNPHLPGSYWARYGDGYMFVSGQPIKASPMAAAPVLPPPPAVEQPRSRRWWWASGGLVVVIAVSYLIWRQRRRVPQLETHHV